MSFANPLAQGASPGPAHTGSPGSLLPDLDRSTWQREMERAMSAGWFHFDDAMPAPALQLRGEPPVPASPSPPAITSSPRDPRTTAPAPQAATAAHVFAKSRERAQDDAPAGDAPIARPAAAVQGAVPSREPFASDDARAATAAPLPASVQAAVTQVAKPATSAVVAALVRPATLGEGQAPAPVAAAPAAQAIAAALTAALAATPAQGSASAGAQEEPPPVPAPESTPPPARPQDYTPSLRDLFGPDEESGTESAAAKDETSTAEAARDDAKSAKPAAPVRWHAEWDEQGVRVWLGLDSTAGIEAPQLAQQVLQSLGEQGVRVLSLVCNGKALYGSGFPREQNPQSGRGEG